MAPILHLRGSVSGAGPAAGGGRDGIVRAAAASSAAARGRGGRSVSAGHTVLEIVVVLAIIGIVASGGWALVRHGSALRAAQGARTFVLWARLQAVWTGRVVAVVPGTRPALQASASNDVQTACHRGVPTARFELARYGVVRVEEPFREGIAWLPSGGARSCDGGGVISGRMVLAGRGGRASVIVSSLGRVRVESGP